MSRAKPPKIKRSFGFFDPARQPGARGSRSCLLSPSQVARRGTRNPTEGSDSWVSEFHRVAGRVREGECGGNVRTVLAGLACSFSV
jgi:hypothetical protein